MLPLAWLRDGIGARGARPLQEDPPSLTHRLSPDVAEIAPRGARVSSRRPAPVPVQPNDFRQREVAPCLVGPVRQIDRRLGRDLLDPFVAVGAQMFFVGYSTGLHGPSGVVIPYPNHDNHMHVRFTPPR